MITSSFLRNTQRYKLEDATLTRKISPSERNRPTNSRLGLIDCVNNNPPFSKKQANFVFFLKNVFISLPELVSRRQILNIPDKVIGCFAFRKNPVNPIKKNCQKDFIKSSSFLPPPFFVII